MPPGYAATDWSEDTVKTCMSLFLSLLPLNHKLLKEWVDNNF